MGGPQRVLLKLSRDLMFLSVSGSCGVDYAKVCRLSLDALCRGCRALDMPSSGLSKVTLCLLRMVGWRGCFIVSEVRRRVIKSIPPDLSLNCGGVFETLVWLCVVETLHAEFFFLPAPSSPSSREDMFRI